MQVFFSFVFVGALAVVFAVAVGLLALALIMILLSIFADICDYAGITNPFKWISSKYLK